MHNTGQPNLAADSSAIDRFRIVLASGSPRRLDLLAGLGLKFEVLVSDIDEQTDLKEPSAIVRHLSLAKALAVAERLSPQTEDGGEKRTLVIGADTIVVIDGEALGKPESPLHAYEMLMRLSGRAHQVFTGVAVVDCADRSSKTLHQVSHVYFRQLDPAEVRHYVSLPEPMDKAGAYALQGVASAFVQRIDGCYTNIIGLPVPDTLNLLREFGLPVLGIA